MIQDIAAWSLVWYIMFWIMACLGLFVVRSKDPRIPRGVARVTIALNLLLMASMCGIGLWAASNLHVPVWGSEVVKAHALWLIRLGVVLWCAMYWLNSDRARLVRWGHWSEVVADDVLPMALFFLIPLCIAV